MDGLYIAAAIIHFIEYAGRLVASGQSRQYPLEHRELGSIAKGLLSCGRQIEESLRSQHREHTHTNIGSQQHQTASHCQGIAGELLDAIELLQAAGPGTKWRSFRHALRTVLSDSAVHAFDKNLRSLRHQTIFTTIDSLRVEASRLSRAQAALRHASEEAPPVPDRVVSVGDRFINDNRLGDTWRKFIIHSILENQRNPNAMLPPFLGLKPKGAWARAYENGVRARVLHRLTFRNMEERERQIPEAEEGTFRWVFRDPVVNDKPWSSFRNFLRWPTSKIYWITGKPGSGKSALMKHIRHSQETRNLLRYWSGGRNVLQARFYFCNSGDSMQTSIEGLLQSLLLDCLRQVPSLAIQRVLPARWEVACLFDQDDVPWGEEDLLDALRTLLTDVFAHQKFFFLIDGLDEYLGEQSQLIDLIMDLAEMTNNLKLCISSRCWPQFHDTFMGRPHLVLENLTDADIGHYIETKFEESSAFCQLRQREPENFERLMRDTSFKAEGCFLWAQLAVQYLTDALSNGDMIGDLEDRLGELFPGDIERILEKIIESLDEEDRDHASQIYQIVRACDDFATVLCVALADLVETSLAKSASAKVMPIQYKESLSKVMRRTLFNRCQGLLHIPAASMYEDDSDESEASSDQSGNESDDEADEDETSGTSSSDRINPISHLEIKYIHRVVKDYIESPHIWDWIVSMSSVRFDPNLSLCKANILQFKGLDPLSLSMSEFWFHAEMAIKYAVRCMNVEGNVSEVIKLLDEVDSTGSALTYHYTNPIFVDWPGALGENDHWVTFFLSRISHPNFSHLMAACGVHQYLTRRVRKEDVRNGRLTGEPTSLLITAVQEFSSLSNCDDLAGPHVRVVEALMRKGADCLQAHHGRSAFNLVQRARRHEKHKPVYEDILRVFERYSRRPLPLSMNVDSSMALARQDTQLTPYREANNDDTRSTDGLCEGQNGREQLREGKRHSKQYSSIHIQGKNIKMRDGNDRSELGSQHQEENQAGSGVG
ncbi:unnamed protein product [Clonostachys rosea]|uniref:NACHT domain-containing protein n=1 Tax=Bionectria ochroleuca TaxID=29856 RepID=A0ABY6UDI4_BIOOC|nr:unnamed protein product [Clonostachys rosea]